MKAYEIIEQIKVNTLVYKASYYFNVEDVTVRVSNHLPKRYNWDENENKEKLIKYIFYFIFASLSTYALYLIYIKYINRIINKVI